MKTNVKMISTKCSPGSPPPLPRGDKYYIFPEIKHKAVDQEGGRERRLFPNKYWEFSIFQEPPQMAQNMFFKNVTRINLLSWNFVIPHFIIQSNFAFLPGISF